VYNQNDKKTDILLSAVKVFGRDGFHKAKVSDIAAEANIGKGTIYEYFSSKKSLFEEMIQFCIDEYFNEANKFIEKRINPIEKLKKYILIEKKMIVKYGDLANIFVQEADKIGKEVKNIVLSSRNKKIFQIQKIIDEGIENGIFKKVDSRAAALTFIGATHQILIDSLVFGYCKDEELRIDTLMDLFLNGIK